MDNRGADDFDLFSVMPPKAVPAEAPPSKIEGRGYKLRWCQKQDSDAAIHALRSGFKRISSVASTAYGKSPVVAENVARLLENGKAVCLVDRQILAYQLADALAFHLRRSVGCIADGVCTGLGADVVVSTVQAMYTPGGDGRRLYEYKQFQKVGSVHLDEAHGFFAPEFQSVPLHFIDECGAVVVGYTATPSAASGAAWNTFFDWTAPAEGPCMRTVRWCRDQGLIVPPKQAFVRSSLRIAELYDKADEERDEEFAKTLVGLLTNRDERAAAQFAKGIHEIIGDRPSIIFAPPVRGGGEPAIAAKKLAAWLGNLLPCEAVWGGRADRDEAVQRLRDGRLQALANVNMLTTGVDIKHISAVFICRLVKQWRLTQQMVGRALRPSEAAVKEIARLDGPENAGARRAVIAASDKPDALIADLVGLDGKVLHASAIDVLYADAGEDVCREMGEMIRSKPRAERAEQPDVDDATLEAAKLEVLRKQNERLAEMARQRAMAGELPADVSVTYDGGMSAALPSMPTPKSYATLGERAMFVAMATQYDTARAADIADRTPRHVLKGMTFSMKRKLEKDGGRPDWNRARLQYPEWSAELKARKAGARK